MTKKDTLKFSGYHLIIGEKSPFDLSCFDVIEDSETEQMIFDKETLYVKKIKK